MIPDLHEPDAAQPSALRVDSVPITAPQESQAGVTGRPVRWHAWGAAMRWGVCVTYVMLVTWLSLAPSGVFDTSLARFPQADKLAHFLMYGFFVVVLGWAMTGSGLRWRPQGFWVPLAALIYGGLMEFAQLLLVPADRSFEVWDMVANGVGALVFWGACNLWSQRRLRKAARTM